MKNISRDNIITVATVIIGAVCMLLHNDAAMNVGFFLMCCLLVVRIGVRKVEVYSWLLLGIVFLSMLMSILAVCVPSFELLKQREYYKICFAAGFIFVIIHAGKGVKKATTDKNNEKNA